jgi:dihydrofolate synthase / folylpolyglutamate synthase
VGDDTAYADAVAALEARGMGRMLPDLDRITRLAALLGDPQLSYPSVHVTGTNGKGSVVRMVGALCSAAGMSAGTYTSPHLQSLRERFTLAGRHISPRRFAEVHDEVVPLAALVDEEARNVHPDDRVTSFELLTAMAYAWFADAPVDVGVFEVGMGGRWDATNVVRGDVAVINVVDVDHSELGATPVEVAREKVGIVKPGALVVSARQPPEVLEVIEDAVTAAGARLWLAGRDFDVVDRQVAVGGQLVTLRIGDRQIDDVLLPLFGDHQADNAALALAAFAGLTGDAFTAMEDDVVRHGLGAVVVPGRMEIARRDPTVVLDVAHNPHGARASAAAVDEAFGFRELVLVAACLADKDIDGILTAFRDAASQVLGTAADSPRAASV